MMAAFSASAVYIIGVGIVEPFDSSIEGLAIEKVELPGSSQMLFFIFARCAYIENNGCCIGFSLFDKVLG